MLTQLWIGGTENWENEEELIKLIQDITKISPRNVWFARDRVTGLLQNYGFLEFATMTEASQVIALLKGTMIPNGSGQRFNINWGNLRPEDSDAAARADGFSVYVGNLPTTIDDNKLLEYFKRYFPNVINTRLIYQNGVSRGFGFVKFSTHQEVKEAIAKLNGATDFGRAIRVSEAQKNRVNTNDNSSESTNTTLFISDIDPSIVNETILAESFRMYGNVIKIQIDPDRPSWATIKMETHQAAESAKNALQGSRFGGTTKAIIQWGRSVDDIIIENGQSVTVPVIKPPKNDRKEHAKYLCSKGIKNVVDIMSRYSEYNRPDPMPSHTVANAEYAIKRMHRQNVFDWYDCSTSIPSSVSFWHYPKV